jgi:hypothetical protein
MRVWYGKSLKVLMWLLFVCSACAAQDRTPAAACPLTPTVAGTNVPFRSGEHIVVWFENRGDKKVSRTQLQLTMIDAFGQRHPAAKAYVVDSQVRPSEAGLMMESSLPEAEHLGPQWGSVRGIEVQVTDITFADGTQWHSASSLSCSRIFYNAAYEHDMRAWNAALRTDWNRRHPEDPMPEPALAAWLLPRSEGW